MTWLQKVSLRAAAVAASLAASAAVLTSVALVKFGAPEGANDRIAVIEGKAEQARGLLRPARNAQSFGPSAICARSADDQALSTRELLTAYAGEKGLQLQGLDIRPDYPADEGARLIPVRIRFEATGGYEAAVGLLDRMASERPQIFVEAVDIAANTSSATVTFSGLLFCSA